MTFEQIKFLGTWAMIGVFIGSVAATMRVARELIIIEGKSLVLRKELAFFSKSRTFALAEVRNLRPMPWSEYHGQRHPDMVAFDHKSRTYRFGKGLSEQEIMRLIKTIQSRFPIPEAWNDVEPLPVLE